MKRAYFSKSNDHIKKRERRQREREKTEREREEREREVEYEQKKSPQLDDMLEAGSNALCL